MGLMLYIGIGLCLVVEMDKKNSKTYANNPDILLLPGIIADKKTEIVTVQAEATGLGDGEIAEFMIVSSASGHGYESLLWVHAKPSDLDKAMRFIGLRPGAPFNPRKLRFQAKGDRVKVCIEMNDHEGIRVENLILDSETDEPSKEEGFVFGGSFRTDKGEYGADVYEPHSIVSMFNTPVTVLDVPREANQQEVYETNIVNGDYVLKPNQLVTLTFEKDTENGTNTEAEELTLTVNTQKNVPATDSALFILTDKNGKKVNKDTTFKGVIDSFMNATKAGKSIYLSLKFAPDLSISDAKKVASIILLLEMNGAVTIEPPEDTQIYYRAFIPNGEWKDYKNRFRQPWELHLTKEENNVKGNMIRHEAKWVHGNEKPEFKTVTYNISSGEQLREKLDTYKPPKDNEISYGTLNVLLLYADDSITCGEILSYISPVKKTHGTIHIFQNQPPAKPDTE